MSFFNWLATFLVGLFSRREYDGAPVAPPPPDRFTTCLSFVLKSEGGFVQNPTDPGGATNMGITLTTLKLWRGAATVDDVRNLTQDEAAAIYRKFYWNAMRCGDLPEGVDLVVLDAGVMSGQSRAARMLQSAVGAVEDGAIGPDTVAATQKMERVALIGRLSDLRSAYYRSLDKPQFINGWLNRVENCRAAALGQA